MSLKHIHIGFVSLCALCAGGFAAWALLAPEMSSGIRAMGWLSAVGAVGLSIYGVRFYRKMKDVIT